MKRLKRESKKLTQARDMLASVNLGPELQPKLNEALGLLRHVEEATVAALGRAPTARERRESLSMQSDKER